jgi:hypothetical protein
VSVRPVPWCPLAFCVASALGAQANVPQFRGDFGLASGTQAPSGVYAGLFYNYYNPDKIITSDGTVIHRLAINQSALAILLQWVSQQTFLGGAHYSIVAAIPWVNVAIATPNVSSETRWGFSDFYVQPINLGWHFKQIDALATFGVDAPTGRFNPGASNNTGLGMWAVEFGAGATWYPDAKKQFNVATYATYAVPVSDVRGTTMHAGNLLTLEGGVGHTLIKGFGNIGVAYYAQWKVTSDEGYRLPPGFDAKDYYFGIGPEIDIPVPVVKSLPFFVTLKYYFETGNRVATEGNSFIVAFTVAKLFPPLTH